MGKGTETKVAPAPQQPAPEPAKAAKPRTFKKKPHVLETTTAVRLLLRRIADRAHYPNGSTGKVKTARIALAGTDIVALVKEAVQLAVIDKANPIDWRAAADELAYCTKELAVLQGQMKDGDLKQIDAELTAALTAFEQVVPAKAWQQAHDAKAVKGQAALKEDENYELARNAIIAACREVTKFKGSQRGDEERVNTVTSTLPLHFQTASTAARLVKDRDFRLTLRDDMKLASEGMGYLDAFIRMPQRLPWNKLYAAAFDAENDARAAIGMTPEARIYSGTIDPEEAGRLVKATVKDGRVPGSFSRRAFASPEQAVLGLSAALDLMFDQQLAAVVSLASDLREPPKPKQQSWWQKILEAAVKVALATVASGLASYFENAIKARIDAVFAKRSGIPMGVFDLLPASEKTQWLGETLKDNDIFRKVTADAAKDGFKEVIKSGGLLIYQMSLGSMSSATKATEPLNGFTQVQTGALNLQRFEARTMMIHMMNALKQLDFDVLNAMALGISEEVATRAKTAQYDASMNEWQNLKAQLQVGEAKATPIPEGVSKRSVASPKDLERTAKRDWDKQVKQNPELAHEQMPELKTRDAAMDDLETTGTFEIKARVDAEVPLGPAQPRTRAMASAIVESIRMPGAEERTLDHYREKNAYLADVPINKHFTLRFLSYYNEHFVKVGVGPDRGLILSGLGKYERRLLKAYAAGKPVNSQLYFDDELDQGREAEGIALLVSMLDEILKYTRTFRVTK